MAFKTYLGYAGRAFQVEPVPISIDFETPGQLILYRCSREGGGRGLEVDPQGETQLRD